jgi:hypothetical protein
MKGPIQHARGGYSLLELIVCMPVMTLLLFGMAAAIQLARRAMPDGASIPSATLLGGSALDQLASEIAFATSITARSATGITFVTPDRTFDATPESIRYQWSGVAGAPLTRQVNGSAPETLLPGVQSLALTYDTRVDAQSGQQHLQAVNVRMILPAGGSALLDARLETLNEPVVP